MIDGDRDLQGDRDELDASLREARLKQSAYHDAVTDIRDAQTLRLQVLYDELAPLVRARPETAAFIELALVAGDPPRLWIDLTSYVTTAPDPRTFRLVQDTRQGRDILLETKNRSEMHKTVVEFIAHRAVQRQRELPQTAAGQPVPGGRYSTPALILSWLTGFSFGILMLYVAWVLFPLQ
ncbi:MAG: hypothetical protein HKN11_16310 [Rhizobiales bacterium]|nr:hypothetical protein [Hyphomicrobiales bacterium]